MEMEKLISLESRDTLRSLLCKIRITKNLTIVKLAAEIGMSYPTLAPLLKRKDVTEGARISENVLINLAHYVESNGYIFEEEMDRRLEKSQQKLDRN